MLWVLWGICAILYITTGHKAFMWIGIGLAGVWGVTRSSKKH